MFTNAHKKKSVHLILMKRNSVAFLTIVNANRNTVVENGVG